MRARGAHAAKFSFLKNHRGLKNYFFSRKFVNTFLFLQKNLGKKKILNLKMSLKFGTPTNGQIAF